MRMDEPENALPGDPEADDLIRQASSALARAGTDPAGCAAEASIWLDAADEKNLGIHQLDTVNFLRCIVMCLSGEFNAAYQRFRVANRDREVPTDWRGLAVAIYAKRTPIDGDARALQECNTAIEWVKQGETHDDQAAIMSNLYGHKAFHHLQLGQYQDAEASCKVALQTYPNYLGPLRILAYINLRNGQPESAIQYLSESIARRTEGPHFWDFANRGKAFLDVGNISAAFSDLTVALDLDPNNPTVLSNLGIAADAAGDTSAAWRFYAQALQQDYNWAPAHHNRGVLFYNLKEYGDADRAFSRAIQSESANPMLWFNRAVCRFEQQMYGEALADLGAAGERRHRSWELLYLMGMCKGRLGEYSSGLTLLRSIADNPLMPVSTLSMIWNNMGVMAQRNSDERTAHECFSKAAFVDPLNEQAITNIDRIEATMSGQELQPTEESIVSISVGPLPSILDNATPSDLLSAVSIVTNIASIGVALVL